MSFNCAFLNSYNMLTHKFIYSFFVHTFKIVFVPRSLKLQNKNMMVTVCQDTICCFLMQLESFGLFYSCLLTLLLKIVIFESSFTRSFLKASNSSNLFIVCKIVFSSAFELMKTALALQ